MGGAEKSKACGEELLAAADYHSLPDVPRTHEQQHVRPTPCSEPGPVGSKSVAGAGFVPLAAYGQDLTRSLWEQVGGAETLPKSCVPLFIGNLNSELKRGKLDKELVDAVVTHVLE